MSEQTLLEKLNEHDIAAIGMECGLGRLTELLDDDQWNNIEPTLMKFAKVMYSRGFSAANAEPTSPPELLEALIALDDLTGDPANVAIVRNVLVAYAKPVRDAALPPKIAGLCLSEWHHGWNNAIDACHAALKSSSPQGEAKP